MQAFATIEDARDHVRHRLGHSEGTYDTTAITRELYTHNAAHGGFTSVIMEGDAVAGVDVYRAFWDVVTRHEIIVPDDYRQAAGEAYIATLLDTEALMCDPCGEAGGHDPDICDAGEDFHCGDVYSATFFPADMATDEADVLADLVAFLGSEEVWPIARQYPAKIIGSNFALTRQGHGTGFWDTASGITEADGVILTREAHTYGEAYLSAAGGQVHYRD